MRNQGYARRGVSIARDGVFLADILHAAMIEGFLPARFGDAREAGDDSSFQYLAEYLKGRMVGHLFAAGCTIPEEIGEDAKAHAVEFASMLSGQSP
jgi:hypothetical protein